MKKAIDIVSTVLLVLVIVFAFLLVGVRIFGVMPYTVLSGSMRPAYFPGSLIYVRDTSIEELEVGDPITFKLESGTVVTHRIIEVIVDEDDPTLVSYRTQGDACDTPDGDPVPFSRVIGKPVFHVPLMGFVAVFIKTPLGIALAVSVMLLLVCLAFIPDIVKSILTKETLEQVAEETANDRAEMERLMAELKELEAQKNDSDKPN